MRDHYDFSKAKRGAVIEKKEVCPICHGSGWNHGVQCKPSKAHPKGWKSEKCECQEK